MGVLLQNETGGQPAVSAGVTDTEDHMTEEDQVISFPRWISLQQGSKL